MASKAWDDVFAGCVAIGMAMLYKIFAIDYDAANIAMTTSSSGAYTDLLVNFLALCGAVCFIKAVFKFRKISNTGENGSKEKKASYRSVALCAVTLFLYVYAMPWVGFVVATILAGGVMLFIMGEKSKKRIVLIPVCWTLAVYAVFNEFLMIPLPEPFFM